MHELSIALSMVDEIGAVTEEARSKSRFKVKCVRLALGVLSGVDAKSLQFCYKAVSEDTFLEGSYLMIEQIPVVVRCEACNADTMPASIQHLCCAHCSSAGQVIQGHELEISALEVLE